MSARIRLAQPSDAAAVAAIYAPVVEQTPTSFELVAPDEQEMRRRITSTLEHYPWLVCEAGGELLGYVYATRHRERPAYRWSVEVSAYVATRARRRGVGRALYTSLFELLARQGFHQAFAGITLPNEASVRLHQSLGFAPIGVFRRIGFKFGAWHDVGWWQRDLSPLRDEPAEPRPLPELLGEPGFDEWLATGEALLKGG